MKNIFNILLILLVGGCAFTPYNTQFECPLEKGVPCTRLSTINKMIDRGELGEEGDTPSGPMCKGDCFKKEISKDPQITYFQKKKEIPATFIEEPKEEGRGQEGYIFFEEEGEF
jgi:hypothetical protein